MKHGTYIGDRADLKGKTALLKPKGVEMLAQFDDRSLGDLAFGWHPFSYTDWEVDIETDWAFGVRQ